VRAVPLNYLRELFSFAKEQSMSIHMHIAEQPAEVRACLREYGRTPVELLASEGLLNECFTGIHGIHITREEARALGRARSMICACPTTERNLGDGVVPADMLFEEQVRVSLGADSHTQVDLLEDARELEYNMRLNRLQRVVLHPEGDSPSALAAALFDCATLQGAQSIDSTSGAIEPGRLADFFTVSLDDPSIAGASSEDLLSHIVFSLSLTAVRDVFVGGRQLVEEGRHAAQHEIVERFTALQRRLWS
jgi:formimidoylglutamate deiminase